MSHFAKNPVRAHVVAEAVVSAYIDEIARSGRRARQRPAPCAPSTRAKPAAAHSRARTSRLRRVAVELGA
jgi:hypothetical protein